LKLRRRKRRKMKQVGMMKRKTVKKNLMRKKALKVKSKQLFQLSKDTNTIKKIKIKQWEVTHVSIFNQWSTQISGLLLTSEMSTVLNFNLLMSMFIT
jgi:hypothetical protein